ncbi:hypothetical protein PINS_up004277 [Pythium insidiosum]|nr:hypothetical protein PINS_up004277 [Pythium insidiosum]
MIASDLDERVDFMDRDGVLRRSSSITRRMLIRGNAVGDVEFLHAVDADATRATTSSSSVSTALSQEVADESERLDERPRRHRSLDRRRSSKKQLIDNVDNKVVDRLQRWYDATGLDPGVETSSDHTISSPSRVSQSFVDPDGNLRRKSSIALEREASEARAASPVSKISIRRSTVLEMMQLIVED